jgi:hypothetical protein
MKLTAQCKRPKTVSFKCLFGEMLIRKRTKETKNLSNIRESTKFYLRTIRSSSSIHEHIPNTRELKSSQPTIGTYVFYVIHSSRVQQGETHFSDQSKDIPEIERIARVSKY